MSQKKFDRTQCVVLQLVLLEGEKNCKPRPRHRVLVTVRVSFYAKFSASTPDLFIWEFCCIHSLLDDTETPDGNLNDPPIPHR